MAFRVGAPGAHLVGIVAGILFDRGGGTAIRIAFAQHRIDRAAQGLAVAGTDLFFGGGGRLVGEFRQLVALGLQFLDRRLQLGNGGADIGQLDDIGFRLLGQFTKLGQLVADALGRGEVFREIGDDASGQGNVPGFHRHTGGFGEGLDDRQQRICRQRRSLIDFGPNNLRFRHNPILPSCLSRAWKCRCSPGALDGRHIITPAPERKFRADLRRRRKP